MNKSIGAHRLAIFLGCVATFAWLVIVIFFSDAVQHIGIEEIVLIIAGMVLSFFAAYLFIKGIFWVIEGFSKDKSDS
jgi:predicted transglutaminase-like protease